jgi:hypothetical protein
MSLVGGEMLKELAIRDDGRMAPSALGGGTWTIDVNMFDAGETRLYETRAADIDFEVEVSRVTWADGSELALVTSLEQISEGGR